jgi:thiamine biosynthesis lipoprotein
MAAEQHFRVMGSDAHVIVVGGPERLVTRARHRLQELERRWSRFLPGSEVSRLNRRAGHPVVVSSQTRLLVRRALDGHALTAGAFDPTVLGAVLRAGYDRTFEELHGANGRSGPLSLLRTGAGEIELDELAGTVRLPHRVGFDPGGLGKGLAADLVVEELRSCGAAGVCVNVGGDLRVSGTAPDGRAWRVEVEDPLGDEPLAILAIVEGAVATSSRLRRRWIGPDGQDRHHLIDPLLGHPAETPNLAATVVSAHGWRAEVLAKAVLLDAQGRDGLALVDRLGAAGLLVSDGGVRTTSGWTAFERGQRREAAA